MMHSASDQPSSEKRRFTLPRRTTSIIITLIVHLLLLLLLITLSPPRTFIPMGGGHLISISVSDQNDAAKAKSQSKAKAATKQSKTTAAAAASKPVPPPPVPNPNSPEVQVLRLTHDEMVGLDATLRSHSNNSGQQSADASAGDSSGDSEKAGTGAHGEQLYAAEWYRKPTDAELNTYMPHNKIGWGDVACRTAPRYHVEDCYELDESPRGSQISRGVREAAWQFLVRPPRVGGHVMVGEWVRIRITLYDRESDLPAGR